MSAAEAMGEGEPDTKGITTTDEGLFVVQTQDHIDRVVRAVTDRQWERGRIGWIDDGIALENLTDRQREVQADLRARAAEAKTRGLDPGLAKVSAELNYLFEHPGSSITPLPGYTALGIVSLEQSATILTTPPNL